MMMPPHLPPAILTWRPGAQLLHVERLPHPDLSVRTPAAPDGEHARLRLLVRAGRACAVEVVVPAQVFSPPPAALQQLHVADGEVGGQVADARLGAVDQRPDEDGGAGEGDRGRRAARVVQHRRAQVQRYADRVLVKAYRTKTVCTNTLTKST